MSTVGLPYKIFPIHKLDQHSMYSWVTGIDRISTEIQQATEESVRVLSKLFQALLENTTMANILEEVIFPSNIKKGKLNRVWKLLYNIINFVWRQNYA